jgi:hypothetical protein
MLGKVDFRGSVQFSDFELFLLFSFACRFSCHLLAFVVFLLLDDILQFCLKIAGGRGRACPQFFHG